MNLVPSYVIPPFSEQSLTFNIVSIAVVGVITNSCLANVHSTGINVLIN